MSSINNRIAASVCALLLSTILLAGPVHGQGTTLGFIYGRVTSGSGPVAGVKACSYSPSRYVIEKSRFDWSGFGVNGRFLSTAATTSGRSSASTEMIQGAPLQAWLAGSMPDRMSRRMTV